MQWPLIWGKRVSVLRRLWLCLIQSKLPHEEKLQTFWHQRAWLTTSSGRVTHATVQLVGNTPNWPTQELTVPQSRVFQICRWWRQGFALAKQRRLSERSRSAGGESAPVEPDFLWRTHRGGGIAYSSSWMSHPKKNLSAAKITHSHAPLNKVTEKLRPGWPTRFYSWYFHMYVPIWHSAASVGHRE